MISQIPHALRTLAAATLLVLFSSSSALAAIQQHTFTITGDNGETGSGTFSWDDTAVPDGTPLNTDTFTLSGNVLAVNITISGGNVVGGSTTFTRADCQGAFLQDTPDFVLDINWWCDNGSNQLFGANFFTNELNGGTSELIFTPGATAPATVSEVPTLPFWLLSAMAAFLGLSGLRYVQRRQ